MKRSQRNAKNTKSHKKSYPKDDYSDSESSYDDYDDYDDYNDSEEEEVNEEVCEKRVTIDIRDDFGLADIIDKIKNNEYKKGKRRSGKINVDLIVEDLKRCLVIILNINPIFIVKDYDADNKVYKLSYTNQNTVSSTLGLIIVGKVRINGIKKKSATLWDIVKGYLSEFKFKGSTFYSREPGVFSLFRGYDYKVLDDVDMDLISPFLNHIREVIANGNVKIYTYILNWIAKILQTPDYQSGIVIMILGAQGTGKNTFSDAISQLMRRYAQPNLSMNSVVGGWNTLLRNMKLAVINELQSQTNNNNKYKDGDDLKTIITEDTIVIKEKYVNDMVMKNVCNFIMISNNNTPFRIEMGDRRYLVVRTNDKYAGVKSYFDELYKTINTEGFYENLFTYFMKYDTQHFSIHPAPKTKEWWRIVNATKPTYQIFFTKYYTVFDGVRSHKYLHKEIYNMYEEFCQKHRRQPMHMDSFIGEIAPYLKKIHTTRSDLGVNKVHLYYLTPEAYKEFEKQAKAAEEIEEEIKDGEPDENNDEKITMDDIDEKTKTLVNNLVEESGLSIESIINLLKQM